MEVKQIAVLITCHNRKVKTINCLSTLFRASQYVVGYSFNVYLVDDGSTDGTEDSIRTLFPAVTVIQGNGSLYWNRGMFTAWKEAAKKEYDYYLWLNDDTYVYDDTLKLIIETMNTTDGNTIIVGTTCSLSSKQKTYGGYNVNNELINPNGEIQSCCYFNGNCVMIPKSVYKLVGNLDYCFRHAVGDIDYGLRAVEKGVKLYIAPYFIGTCERHTSLPIWWDSSQGLQKRLGHLYSPLGNNPFTFFIFEYRHYGLLIALKHFFSIHLRVFLPRLWNKQNENFINS